MPKQKGKMSFDKICRILANEWEEEFNFRKADQIATWVDNLKSEITRKKIPAEDRRGMIENVIAITKERRENKAGEDYIEINDKTFLTLSAYLRQKSEQFFD